MPDFVVHSIPGSPFGRAVLATLEEKSVSWTLHPVGPGAFRQPPHLQRHPFGRVPVLDHGDFRLYETQAILRYLDRVLPHPPLTPADPRQAARMDQVMAVNDWYLFAEVARPIVFHRIVSPRLLGGTPDEAVIAAALPQAAAVIAELSRLLGDQEFMAGDALSLADLHVGPQLAMLAETPEWAGLTESHPNLAPWLRRLESRRSFSETTWERLIERAEAA
jgi:glutathione S-transferase